MSGPKKWPTPWTNYLRGWLKAADPCVGCEDEECANARKFACPFIEGDPEDDARVDHLFSERVKSKGFRRLVPDRDTGEMQEEDV